MKSSEQKYHTLYAKDKVWKFKTEGELTGMTFIDKHRVLILLREYSYLISYLVELNLRVCNKQRVCNSSLLAKFDSEDGWKIDNFEGVTKVGKNRFLMVSDDNDSLFQKTLLVLFEITR